MKLKIKPTTRYHSTSTRVAQEKRLAITSVGKDMEKLEPCTLFAGNIK
jgi:hypothetical protein